MIELKHLKDGTCKTFSVNRDDDRWVMRLSIPGMKEQTGFDFVWYEFTDNGWESVTKKGSVAMQHALEKIYQGAKV